MRKLGFFSLVLGSALALGCSRATATDSIGSNELNTVVDPDYLTFASRAEAETWFTGYRPKIEALFGPGAGPALAENDAQTVRVQALIAKHWPTVVARFGVTIPMPYAIVVPTTWVNA